MASLSPGVLGTLDPTSDRAVFRQIADQVREAIDKGRFKEGAKLPSEAELVDHFGVSRMTVRNALSILQGGRAGPVRARPGCLRASASARAASGFRPFREASP